MFHIDLDLDLDLIHANPWVSASLYRT